MFFRYFSSDSNCLDVCYLLLGFKGWRDRSNIFNESHFLLYLNLGYCSSLHRRIQSPYQFWLTSVRCAYLKHAKSLHPFDPISSSHFIISSLLLWVLLLWFFCATLLFRWLSEARKSRIIDRYLRSRLVLIVTVLVSVGSKWCIRGLCSSARALTRNSSVLLGASIDGGAAALSGCTVTCRWFLEAWVVANSNWQSILVTSLYGFIFVNLQFMTACGILRSVGEFILDISLVIGAHISPCCVSLIVGDDLLAHVCSSFLPFFLHVLKVFGGCSSTHTVRCYSCLSWNSSW